MTQTKIGIIGCGMMSQRYMHNFTTYYHSQIKVAAVADIVMEKARQTAQQFDVPKACTVEELLADPEVEIVLNLTIPEAHMEINCKALNAGKHVYCEKPLATTLEDAAEQIRLAEEKGLRLGCAPDTFLGSGIQTCRKLIDDGWIGELVGATANIVIHGHELWYPTPEFFYKKGGGPVLDLGPYYIAAMVSLLGPVKNVNCYARRNFNTRRITSKAQKGKIIDVDINTHFVGMLEFSQGLIANFTMSFDLWESNLPRFEIYGTKGTLIVPYPLMFSGPVKLLRGNEVLDYVDGLDVEEAVERIHSGELKALYREVPLLHETPFESLNGLGVVEMADAIRNNRLPRISHDFINHVFEVLLRIEQSPESGGIYQMISTCERPEPIPSGLPIGQFSEN